MREEEEGKEEAESDKFDGLIQMVLRDLGDDGGKKNCVPESRKHQGHCGVSDYIVMVFLNIVLPVCPVLSNSHNAMGLVTISSNYFNNDMQ